MKQISYEELIELEDSSEWEFDFTSDQNLAQKDCNTAELSSHQVDEPISAGGKFNVHCNANKENVVTPKHSLTRPKDSSILLPTHHKLVEENLTTYVYPTDMQVRDYQRNIIRKALVRNLICALPTGLGKTFIASIVMLNWYRWTKTAKIIFIAPTRPLVTQQAESFLGITGISIDHTAILLQEIQKKQNRHEEWNRKRVFFATAQTVANDLKAGIVDPRDVVLLVLDEAHRATGSHSYVEVVNHIKSKNSSFRILGLTATPSAYFQGVQDIVDLLQISTIEVRSENSLDIRKYVHERQIDKIRVELSSEIKEILRLLALGTEHQFDVLRSMNLTSARDVTGANDFMLRKDTDKFMRSPAAQVNKGRAFFIRTISALMQSLCYNVKLLKTHGIATFYARMHQNECEWMGSKGKHAQELIRTPEIKEVLKNCRIWMYGQDKGPTFPYSDNDRKIGFHGHPKLTELINQIDRFLQQNNADSRIIIFAEFRDSAAEIMWMVKNYNANVRAHVFVGQSTNVNKSIKGMSQKEQQKVLSQFKSGEFNVLVATSIGEEGLDIGQVDLIICYDQSKSPIRNVQRMGRTGRQRQGKVLMLMTTEEEKKLAFAFEGHSYIRDRITDSNESKTGNGNSRLTIKYHPIQPLLPSDVDPQYTEVKIQLPPENEEALAYGDILAAFKSKASKVRAPAKHIKRLKRSESETPITKFGFCTGEKLAELNSQVDSEDDLGF